ncbi:MAG TPA: efflux RND transporter periplasmic adaptor subunit [Terriglobia bacterium]|nr:efflux RND transporter periplasmic adaptor subunit [Terriglobia bacterium]
MFAILGAVLAVPLVLFLRSIARNPPGFANETRVARGKIDSHLAARGRVEGATSQEIKLASRVVGRLKEVPVNDGDILHKGQIVAVLENNDLQAQVEQSRANIMHAQAVLERLQNGARPEERAASRAAMNEAQAAADNARQNFERSQKLFSEGGIISQSVLDQAERDSKMAQARLESARENYKLVMAPPRPEDVAAAQAELSLARAQLAQVQDNYDNTFVRSPVDGVVVKRYMNPGESISYESLYQPIVSVSDTTHLMVRTEIDETDVGKIQIGQHAAIRCDAFRGQTFYGHVVRISGGLGPKKIQTDNPTEKIDMDVLESFVEVDPGSPLRVGLRVDVYIELARKDNVLVIPLHAVEFQEGVATVHVRTSSGVQSRKVQLGAQDGLNIEVADGVREGEELVY